MSEGSWGQDGGGEQRGGESGEGREGKILNSTLDSRRVHGARLFPEGWGGGGCKSWSSVSGIRSCARAEDFVVSRADNSCLLELSMEVRRGCNGCLGQEREAVVDTLSCLFQLL